MTMKLGGSKISDLLSSGLRAVGLMRPDGARVRGDWEVVCRGADGLVKWTERFTNLVTDEGLNELLKETLAAGAQTTAWYVGLKNTGAPAAADVMNSHGGWTENVTYSDGTRKAWTPGTVTGKSVSNSASKASFAINGSTTIFGAFLTSGSAKSGTTGILYSAGDFASSRAVVSGDTLDVTATFTTSDDGV